jgi:hypothetical protein
MPPAGVTHVAWQIWHLAMAEFRLALERVRGPQPGDRDLISEAFLSNAKGVAPQHANGSAMDYLPSGGGGSDFGW